MLESDSVTAGRHVVAHGAGTPALDGDREGTCVVPRPRHLEADGGAVGAARLLADDERHGTLDAVQRDRRGRIPAAARTVEGEPDVLLVHPAVEDPHRHELRAGHLADRAPADRGPFRRGRARPAGPAGSWSPRRTPPARPDPGSARRTATKRSLVAANSFFTWSPRGPGHSGTGSPMIARSIPMRCESWSLTSQPGHSVGSAHSVVRQRRSRPPPALPRSPPARSRAVSPSPEPVTVLTCTVVAHEADPTPGSCLRSPDHPPFPGTPPLRSTPVQGHHRPKELPWLTTRGTA